MSDNIYDENSGATGEVNNTSSAEEKVQDTQAPKLFTDGVQTEESAQNQSQTAEAEAPTSAPAPDSAAYDAAADNTAGPAAPQSSEYSFRSGEIPKDESTASGTSYTAGAQQNAYSQQGGTFGQTFAGQSYAPQGSCNAGQTNPPQGNPYAAQGQPHGYTPYNAGGQFTPPMQGQQYGYAPNAGQPFTPPYNGAGGYGAPRVNPQGQSFTPPMPPKPPKKHKPRKGLGVVAIALLCVAGLLLSAGAGFGGAYLYNTVITDSGSKSGAGTVVDGTEKVVDEDGTTVYYRDLADGTNGIAGVANTVRDSVVEITTEYVSNSNSFFGQYVTEGAGSGVVIYYNEQYYILTNSHVISASSSGSSSSSSQGVADKITVRFTDGTESGATVVANDSDSDIAILKLDIDDTTKLVAAKTGDSDSLVVGESVVAVGNPLGELGGTVTNGIISALDREIQVGSTTLNLLQTNAAVNPGNSGGGLFNMEGELIGIVNAKYSETGVEGLGFAIPVNDVYEVVDQLLEFGYVKGKSYVGISLVDVTDQFTAWNYGLNSTGVYISSVTEGFNDDKLKVGDRIVAVDGKEITSSSDVKNAVTSHSVGDTIKFSLYRNNQLIEVEVKCYENVPQNSDSSVNFGEQ